MVKLTEAQMRALNVLAIGPVLIATWGGMLMGRMPYGIRSTATLWALHKSNLVTVENRGGGQVWTITEAGRAALTKEGK